MPMALASGSHYCINIINAFLSQDNQNEVQYDFFSSCDLIMYCTHWHHITASTSQKLRKEHQTATFIFLTIKIHVPTTNMTLKCHRYAIYANYLCIYMRQLCQYIYLIWTQCNQQCHHKSWYTSFTLLTCASEQICVSHCICIYQWTTTVVYKDSTLLNI